MKGIYNSDVVNKDLLEKIFPNGNVLESIFLPYIGKMHKKNNVIIKCKLDKFIKKFKITSNILSVMEEIWNVSPCVLGGGKMIDFLNNKNIEESTNDFDIFFLSLENSWDGICKVETLLFNKYKPGAMLSYIKEYINEDIKYQLIMKEYPCIEEIIENFDIRACAICTDGEYVYWLKGAIKDNQNKQIIFSNPRSNLHSIYRINKYIDKGFEIKIPDFAIACIKFLDGLMMNEGGLNPETRNQELFNRNYIYDRTIANTLYEEFLEDQVPTEYGGEINNQITLTFAQFGN